MRLIDAEELTFKINEIAGCDAKVIRFDIPTCMGKPIFEYCPFCGAKMGGAE